MAPLPFLCRSACNQLRSLFTRSAQQNRTAAKIPPDAPNRSRVSTLTRPNFRSASRRRWRSPIAMVTTNTSRPQSSSENNSWRLAPPASRPQLPLLSGRGDRARLRSPPPGEDDGALHQPVGQHPLPAKPHLASSSSLPSPPAAAHFNRLRALRRGFFVRPVCVWVCGWGTDSPRATSLTTELQGLLRCC